MKKLGQLEKLSIKAVYIKAIANNRENNFGASTGFDSNPLPHAVLLSSHDTDLQPSYENN